MTTTPGEDLHTILDAAKTIASHPDGFDPSQKQSLLQQLQTIQLKLMTNHGAGASGIRASSPSLHRISAHDRTYLILLPPDDPGMETCAQCGAQRLQGNGT